MVNDGRNLNSGVDPGAGFIGRLRGMFGEVSDYDTNSPLPQAGRVSSQLPIAACKPAGVSRSLALLSLPPARAKEKSERLRDGHVP
jgi:hypothetical protein